MKNRVGNLKRNKYERKNTPCESCPFNAWIKKTNECKKFDCMLECDLYRGWYYRNTSKKNIMQPINSIAFHCLVELEDEVNVREIMEDIEREIPANQRKTWLKLKSGAKVGKKDRLLFIESIRHVLERYGYA